MARKSDEQQVRAVKDAVNEVENCFDTLEYSETKRADAPQPDEIYTLPQTQHDRCQHIKVSQSIAGIKNARSERSVYPAPAMGTPIPREIPPSNSKPQSGYVRSEPMLRTCPFTLIELRLDLVTVASAIGNASSPLAYPTGQQRPHLELHSQSSEACEIVRFHETRGWL
jgi:hypothetical protein